MDTVCYFKIDLKRKTKRTDSFSKVSYTKCFPTYKEKLAAVQQSLFEYFLLVTAVL